MRPLSTALRTFEVLGHFSGQSHPQKLGEVALALGLSRATAYQRLLTLVAAGWLEQDDVGRYRLSMLATKFAAAALEQANLGARAEPALSRLVSQVRETASLSILDRGLPCIVARVEAGGMLRAEQKIGTYMELAGSASGRVLVAFADEAMRARLRDSGEALPAEETLREVRANGYAVSSGYTNSGVKAIAAPVYDIHGHCRATVSLLAPEFRFDLDRFCAPLVDAADAISRVLQGREGGE